MCISVNIFWGIEKTVGTYFHTFYIQNNVNLLQDNATLKRVKSFKSTVFRDQNTYIY